PRSRHVLLALGLGILERLAVRVDAGALAELDAHPTVRLRVREVGDAVLTHALGELAHLLDVGRIHLGRLAPVGQILLALPLGGLHLLLVRRVAAARGAASADLHLHPTLVVDLRVGHVDAVLAHAGRELAHLLGHVAVVGAGVAVATGVGGGRATGGGNAVTLVRIAPASGDREARHCREGHDEDSLHGADSTPRGIRPPSAVPAILDAHHGWGDGWRPRSGLSAPYGRAGQD